MTRLKPVWIFKSISLNSKIRLMRSLVTSIFLYACESWTLTAELQRRIQATEMRCYHKILHILYKDHVTNEEVHAKIQQAFGPNKDLLTIVKRCKMQWYGHVSRSSGPDHIHGAHIPFLFRDRRDPFRVRVVSKRNRPTSIVISRRH